VTPPHHGLIALSGSLDMSISRDGRSTSVFPNKKNQIKGSLPAAIILPGLGCDVANRVRDVVVRAHIELPIMIVPMACRDKRNNVRISAAKADVTAIQFANLMADFVCFRDQTAAKDLPRRA